MSKKLLYFLILLILTAEAQSQEMNYVSSFVKQVTCSGKKIVQLKITTSGYATPLSLLRIKSKAPKTNNISYWYSGQADSFSTSNFHQEIVQEKNSWIIKNPVTLNAGDNYFWFQNLARPFDLVSFDLGRQDYQLVWADEFAGDTINPNNWKFEHGFVRNNELQWYQEENATCSNGILTIEAKKEKKPNPLYTSGSKDWRRSRDSIEITSSCMLTAGKHSWLYGRFEMRGRIDTVSGYWPAWWTLGETKRWPSNGEIDIMEFYRGKILANIAVGTDVRSKALWYSNTKAVNRFADQHWRDKFHTWRMDWDEYGISLYVDDILLNHQLQSDLYNRDSTAFYPFRQKHYMLLNLAIGGDNGGSIDHTTFPLKYEVDYVRVSQKIPGRYIEQKNFKPKRI